MQIKRARLTENKDYVTYAQKGVGGKFDTIEYHLTLEAGKHISMMSGTDKGNDVRDYFIECEKVALAVPQRDPVDLLNDPAAMRGILLTYTEKVLELEETVKTMAPTVAAYDRIATADGSLCLTDAAKSLQVRRTDLVQWLSASKWIYKRLGCASWIAYQDKLQQGLLEHKLRVIIHNDGNEQIKEQARITAKGMAKLSLVFGKEEVAA